MVAPSAGGSRLPWQRTPTTNPFFTNSKKIRRSKHATNTHKHGRGSYLSDGIRGDSQSPVEAEPLRSKDRGLFTYNKDTDRYSFKQLSQLGRQWRERKCPIFEYGSNRGFEPGLTRLRVRHSTAEPRAPRATTTHSAAYP